MHINILKFICFYVYFTIKALGETKSAGGITKNARPGERKGFMRKRFWLPPLLRNISNALFVLMLLYTTALSLFTYSLYSKQITEDTYQSFEKAAVLADGATESFFHEVSRLSAHLATNEPVFIPVMFQNPANTIAKYNVTIRMQNVLLSYDYLDYIAVYNQETDQLISTAEIGENSGEEMKAEVLKGYKIGASTTSFFHTLSSSKKYSPSSSRDVLTFAAYSNLSSPGKVGAVLMGIKASYLGDLYDQIDSTKYAPFFFLAGMAVYFPALVKTFLWEQNSRYGKKCKKRKKKAGIFWKRSRGKNSW